LKGWWGKALWVDLSRSEIKTWEYPKEIARDFIGGRGFAVKILWDFLKPGVDPLSPDNILIFAAGPLTGVAINSGKLVVASKSPLTGGYGDGNIGSPVAVSLRKAGYDAIIVVGKSKKPSYIYVENERAYILDAEGLWGTTTSECEKRLKEVHGSGTAVVCIGPGGENMVRYATVISQGGRSGGRPGIGAVMGSKNLKALAVIGEGDIPVADRKAVQTLLSDSIRDLRSKEGYEFWVRQGTMATIEWSQTASVLPTYNFREGVFDHWRRIDGYSMEASKVMQRACPLCAMPCGNVVRDSEGMLSELDYENVAMLGSNIGLGHLGQVSVINRLADEMGIDTISLGNTLGFFMEASEKGLVEKDYRIEWGDFKRVREVVLDIAYRRGKIGNMLAEGVKRLAETIGGESRRWAMHVKGLEISAYDCHAAPAMALAYATSPIGAHHKDAWVIAWEVRVGRFDYSEAKVDRVIELQRIRGGIFETMVGCRLPWVELGLDLEWYIKFFKASTGVDITLNDWFTVADRVYTLIRAFWIREYGGWSMELDMPPERWFKEPLSKGPLSGMKLDYDKFVAMLKTYYEKRGWDSRGIPTKSTLRKLGLEYVIDELSKYVELQN